MVVIYLIYFVLFCVLCVLLVEVYGDDLCDELIVLFGEYGYSIMVCIIFVVLVVLCVVVRLEFEFEWVMDWYCYMCIVEFGYFIVE